MRIRLNQGRKMLYSPGSLYSEIPRSDAPVWCVIDPSKSNLAGVIVTMSKQVLLEFELSGNDTDFYKTTMDTTDYCDEVSDFLREITSEVNCEKLFIEKHILSQGNNHYVSMTALTEIRARIVDLAREITGSKAIEINNMAWKGGVLPDGYRGHSEKGSHRFMSERNPKYRSYTDDMTDAYCIMEFAFKKYYSAQNIRCVESEVATYSYTIRIMDSAIVASQGYTTFGYNPEYTPEENAVYFLNRSSEPGICVFPESDIKSLYKYGESLYPNSEPVMLVYK